VARLTQPPMSISVRVRLFAIQRELAGTREVPLELADGADVEAAWAALVGRLSPGALIAADNVLWSGRVSGARPVQPGDENTAALRAFDAAVLADERFTATILPLGDGLLIASWRG